MLDLNVYKWTTRQFETKPGRDVHIRFIVLIFIDLVVKELRYSDNNIVARFCWFWHEREKNYFDCKLCLLAKETDHDLIWKKVEKIRKEHVDELIYPGKPEKKTLNFVNNLTEKDIDFFDKETKRVLDIYKDEKIRGPFDISSH
jgi:hypothetical protein